MPNLKTYVDLRNVLRVSTGKHSLFSKAGPPLSQSNQGPEEHQEVTFLLFRTQINQLRELQSETLDPKAMMDIILGVKDGIAAEYNRYKRADKNPTFRKELIDEVS